VKKLIREIVLTHTYRLGSDSTAEHLNADPANRLLWRHSPRRMSAEEVRDSILAVSGKLDRSAPTEAAVKEMKMIEMRDNGKEAATIYNKADKDTHRSVYLPLLRGVIPKSLEAFDPVTQSLVTGQRDATTVPTQALFMLNSSFVREQSLALAEAFPDAEPSQGISRIYLSALGRPPHPEEIERVKEFLGEYETNFVAPETVSTDLAANRSTDNNGTSDAAANPDDIPRDDQTAVQKLVEAGDAKTAAWMSFIQGVFASAEFRFIR
jgi:hypothetical protein